MIVIECPGLGTEMQGVFPGRLENVFPGRIVIAEIESTARASNTPVIGNRESGKADILGPGECRRRPAGIFRVIAKGIGVDGELMPVPGESRS